MTFTIENLNNAIINGNYDEFKNILSYNKNLISEKNGNIPLFLAINEGNLEIVQYLITQGANIESKTKDGLTPLHFASGNNDIKIVEYLITQGANIESKANDGFTPLHFASRYGHIKIVEYLITHGANINATNNTNESSYAISSAFKLENCKKYFVSIHANKFIEPKLLN